MAMRRQDCAALGRRLSTASLLAILPATLISCSGPAVKVVISGTPGIELKGDYRCGPHAGQMSVTPVDSSPSGILEFEGCDLRCDFSKADAGGEMVLEVFQGSRREVRAVAPPGVKGIKVERDGSGWRSETY